MRVKCSYKAGFLTSQVECTGGYGTHLLGIGSFLQAKLWRPLGSYHVTNSSGIEDLHRASYLQICGETMSFLRDGNRGLMQKGHSLAWPLNSPQLIDNDGNSSFIILIKHLWTFLRNDDKAYLFARLNFCIKIFIIQLVELELESDC